MKEGQPKSETTRVPDYVLNRLALEGVDTVFGIGGSYIAHQLDGFSRTDEVRLICTQHEQAAAMAAECYARLHKSKLGVTMVTSGPGATNLITGVYGAWFDSIPMLNITGQVGTFDLKGERRVRQFGFQETDTVSLFGNFTKFSRQVGSAEELPILLGEAIYRAKEGRPGPVHLDIPIDVQMASFDPKAARGFAPPQKETGHCLAEVNKVLELMAGAERPVLVVGNGIRLSGAEEAFKKLVTELDWPVLLSWGYADGLPEDHPNRLGLFGVYGNRGANFAIQNADFILAIGTRLDGRMTGNQAAFGREAVKVVVDIDRAEAEKCRPELIVSADARLFVETLLASSRSPYGETWRQTEKYKRIDLADWRQRCAEWKYKYPYLKPEHYAPGLVNPYVFSQILSEVLGPGQVVVADCGGNLTYIMQGFKVKEGQRLISTFGNSPMGYALPAAMGASFARPNENIVCVIGDGGIQMNIQELQTIRNHNLPIKILVYNNNGQGIIRQFQDSYIGGRHVGSEEGLPDFVEVARAYKIPAARISDQNLLGNMKQTLRRIMAQPGPMLVDVQMENTTLEPKAEFGNPIEEQSPRLPDEETQANLLIPRWQKKS